MILTNLGIILFIAFISLEHNVGYLLIRPFIESNTSMYPPAHSFWPWIPVYNPATGSGRSDNSSIVSSRTDITSTNYSSTDNTSNVYKPTEGTTNNGTALETSSKRPTVSTSVYRSASTKTTSYWPDVPQHNFWPFIPVEGPKNVKIHKINKDYLLPTHNFWPFIPVRDVISPRPPATRPPFLPPIIPPTVPRLPWPPSTNRYNYGEVIYKSILFFEVQRSGWLPENRKVSWRSHSATDDQGYFGEDLTGGWYDSGDYIKFGLPMAAATSMLLWGLVEYGSAYKSAGLLDDMLDCVRWSLDYFLKAHTEKFVFYGQVGDPYTDHAYWGRPEDMDMTRPAFRLTPESPGSDLIAETAAAMAAAYVAFRDIDPAYAQKMLAHAQDLFEFADNFRGSYSDTIDNAVEFYGSSSDEDELAWAAVWLYRATGTRYYLKRAQHWFRLAPSCWAQSWADKTCGVSVLLYKLTKDRKYKSIIENTFAQWLPGGPIHYTPKGLAFRSEWGTLRYTANMAFVSLVAADLNVQPSTYRSWARRQIHYMLGDSGRSYVVGYGYRFPTRPHHASSSCRSPPQPCTWADYTKSEPNAHILYGALVGGPDSQDNYFDERDDYIHNEVGCEYNGGFQSAIAEPTLVNTYVTPEELYPLDKYGNPLTENKDVLERWKEDCVRHIHKYSKEPRQIREVVGEVPYTFCLEEARSTNSSNPEEIEVTRF